MMHKGCRPMLLIIMMVTMVSTASPVYAAENRVFHMSYEVHNWRGNVTSLDFYDGADATEEEQEAELIVDEEPDADITVDEEAPELFFIVDEEQEPADEAYEIDEPIIVDEEEQEPADSADPSDSEQIPSVVIEEIASEPEVEVEAPEIEAAPEAEDISFTTDQADESSIDSEQIPAVEIIAHESVADPKPEQIMIITTDNATEVEEIETQGENYNNDEESSMEK